MESYAKARYSLLGSASHWFPGENADSLDLDISEGELQKALVNSPWCNEIPGLIRKLRNRIRGQT